MERFATRITVSCSLRYIDIMQLEVEHDEIARKASTHLQGLKSPWAECGRAHWSSRLGMSCEYLLQISCDDIVPLNRRGRAGRPKRRIKASQSRTPKSQALRSTAFSVLPYLQWLSPLCSQSLLSQPPPTVSIMIILQRIVVLTCH